MPRRTALRCLLALLLTSGLAAPLSSSAASDEPVPGTSNEYADGDATYRVYTPRGFRPGMPLLVMVHGCNTSAAQQEGANRLNQLADRKGFVVLYPDHDTATNTEAGTHPVRCWRWYSDLARDAGDPATIAGQTRAVIARWKSDAQRVYVVGMSSGAMITSALGATYPDLYAAIGIVAGCQYAGTAACVAEPFQSVDHTDTQAQLARDAEGEHARVLPVIDIHGDADGTVTPAASPRVIQQWLKTANLVLSGSLAAPLSLKPASTRRLAPRGRRASTTELYRDSQGCLVAQRVVVHGMGHFWPGGSPDPRWFEYEDPTAPNGGELVWAFFSRFRRDATAAPCTER
jgi:poly(hydroxyalkanoate) depolymerase family esterase